MFQWAMTNAPMCHDFALVQIDAKLGMGRGNAMKDMLLHWSPRSPYVRKVLITAHEIGIADRIETVRTVVAASQPNVELMKENPQSRLPTLRLVDGTVIYDSVVICEYFDSLNTGTKLFRKISRAARRTAPPRARRRHAGHDADVARRGAAPGRQSIDQAHAGVAPKDECLGRHAGGTGRRAWALAFLDWPSRKRGRRRLPL